MPFCTGAGSCSQHMRIAFGQVDQRLAQIRYHERKGTLIIRGKKLWRKDRYRNAKDRYRGYCAFKGRKQAGIEYN